MGLSVADLQNIASGKLSVGSALAQDARTTQAAPTKAKRGRPAGTAKDPNARLEKLVELYHVAIAAGHDDRENDLLLVALDEITAAEAAARDKKREHNLTAAIKRMAITQDAIERDERRGIVRDQWQALDGAGSMEPRNGSRIGRDYAYGDQVGAMHAAILADRHVPAAEVRAAKTAADSDFPRNRYVGRPVIAEPINVFIGDGAHSWFVSGCPSVEDQVLASLDRD